MFNLMKISHAGLATDFGDEEKLSEKREMVSRNDYLSPLFVWFP